jgi:hypothetical protein
MRQILLVKNIHFFKDKFIIRSYVPSLINIRIFLKIQILIILCFHILFDPQIFG